MTLQLSLMLYEHDIIFTDQLSHRLSLASPIRQLNYLCCVNTTTFRILERIRKIVVLTQHSQFSSWCQSKAEPAAQLISRDYVVFMKD